MWAAGCSVALGARIIGAKGWRVTEGFDTLDLKEAKALLDTLASA